MPDTNLIIDALFKLKAASQAISDMQALIEEEKRMEDRRKGSIDVEYTVIINNGNNAK